MMNALRLTPTTDRPSVLRHDTKSPRHRIVISAENGREAAVKDVLKATNILLQRYRMEHSGGVYFSEFGAPVVESINRLLAAWPELYNSDNRRKSSAQRKEG
jgi:hypothetical protein